MNYNFKQKIIDTLLVFLLVMSTGGLLFVFNRNLASVSFFILLSIVIIFFGKNLQKSLVNSSFLSLIVIILLAIINYYFAIVEQTLDKYFFYLLTVVLSSLTLFHFQNNRNKEVFLLRLYFVLRLVTVHAFVNFILFFFVKNNLTLITSTYHECQTFLNLFFYMPDRGMSNVFGLEFCRNQGLFWEPGVLQVFLNILFFMEAFVFKKSKKWLLFTALVILTSYSTTGLALLLIQVVVYLKNEVKNNKFILLLVLILIVPVYMVFNVNIDEKIYGEGEFSFQKRLFDLTQPVFIALDHPLTGIGLDIDQFQQVREEFYINSNLNDMFRQLGIQQKLEITSKGSTNSVMYMLAGMGFPTAILFVFMLFKQNIVTEKKKLFFFIVLVSVMSEPLLFKPFFFLFLISGFSHIFYKITSHKQKLV